MDRLDVLGLVSDFDWLEILKLRILPDWAEEDFVSKHTPGPWVFNSDYAFFGGIFGPKYQSIAVMGNGTAKHGAGKGAVVVKANARLIAAAPEMLQRLIELNGYIEGGDAATERIIARATGGDV